jgi:hypothetical protein
MRYGIVGAGVLDDAAPLCLRARAGVTISGRRRRRRAAGSRGRPGIWPRSSTTIFRSDRHITALIEEVGLTATRWHQPRRDAVRARSSRSTPIAVLRFSGLPFVDRVRPGAGVALRRRCRRPAPRT